MKKSLFEIVSAAVYGFAVTPYLVILGHFNIYWSATALVLSIFAYYRFMRWIERGMFS